MTTKNRIVGVPVEIRIGHVPNTSLYFETDCDFLCRFGYDLVIPDYHAEMIMNGEMNLDS